MSTSPNLAANPLRVTTTPEFALGTQVEVSGATYEYIKAGGALSQYYTYIIASTGIATDAVTHALTGGASPPQVLRLGVPQVAFASGDYGWAARAGKFTARVLTLCAAGARLYTSGTAGALDDTSSTQTLISGASVDATVGGADANAAITAAIPLTAAI